MTDFRLLINIEFANIFYLGNVVKLVDTTDLKFVVPCTNVRVRVPPFPQDNFPFAFGKDSKAKNVNDRNLVIQK